MAERKLAFGPLLLVAALMVGVVCAKSSPMVGAEVRSDKPRVTTPDVPADDVTQVAAGNNAFAFDLYKQLLKTETGNLIFSPYSISTALAMTYAGARGDTETQMASAMHFLSQDREHAALNALDLALAKSAKKKPGEDGDPLQLEVANSLWGQADYDFAAAYLDTLALYYGAGVHVVNFANDPEAARQAINAWVSGQTHERIRDLIPKGVIDTFTRLVLANTIYFKGSWLLPFDPALTKDGPFHLLDGSDVQASMMSLDETLGYAQLAGAQAVRLSYAGGDASMLVIVPDEGTFATYESGLTAQTIDAAVRNLERTKVQLSMPKFDFASDFSLSGALKALGMPLAFDDRHPDFAGMNARNVDELYLKEVVHKANITVDEHGTEAAAATGAVAEILSAPAGPVTLTIDRPFIFVIRDDTTGAILFSGRVVNPSAS
jgi:serpin B